MRHAKPSRRASAKRPGRPSNNGLLYPLDASYRQAGVVPPKVREIAADEIPPPYRPLLVHNDAMTHTLENHFGGRVTLRPLSTLSRGDLYCRRVLLVLESSGQPIEMGAISVKLSAFSRRVAAHIQRSEEPLGRLLHEWGVDYTSQPRAFLAITPNAEMMGVFWMREPRVLYGRRTEMIFEGRKIGDIVEVLPVARE
jgi:chorismate-pyruvate lyase